jgi:hypothetical protein
MGLRKWRLFSLRETILLIALLGGLFAWFSEHQALKRAERLFGPLEKACDHARSFGGDSTASHEVDGIVIEWTVHTVSNGNGEVSGIMAGPW